MRGVILKETRRWFYIPLLTALIYATSILVGNFVGQQISFALWGTFFVAETAYIDTLLQSLLCTVATFYVLKKSNLLNIRPKRQGAIIIVIMSILGIVFFSSAAYSIISMLNIENSSAWDTVDNVNMILKVLVFVIAAPITEEIVFRGAIFGGLRMRYNFFVSAFVSSVLFASIHDITPGVIVIFAIGVFLCLAYEKSGGIIVGVIIHAIYNSFAIIPFSDTSNSISTVSTIDLLASVLKMGIAIFIFYKLYKKQLAIR